MTSQGAPDPREAALDRLRQQAAWRVTTVEVSPADLRLAFAALDAAAAQDTADPADGLSDEIERLQKEVEHWKSHAEEAGRGFAQICKDAARISARNVRLAEELEAARQRPTAPHRPVWHDPPSGWYTFGTHAGWDHEDAPRLEFSKATSEDGMPLFERPTAPPEDRVTAAVAEVIAAVEATYPPYNYELRYDGTEDPTAAAYVEAFREVDNALDRFRAAREDNGGAGVS